MLLCNVPAYLETTCVCTRAFVCACSVSRFLVNYCSYDDDDDRLHQRRKLEEDLRVAEDRMDSHVKLRQSELHGALVTFSQVDARITSELDIVS